MLPYIPYDLEAIVIVDEISKHKAAPGPDSTVQEKPKSWYLAETDDHQSKHKGRVESDHYPQRSRGNGACGLLLSMLQVATHACLSSEMKLIPVPYRPYAVHSLSFLQSPLIQE
jgi:hypothetical protein